MTTFRRILLKMRNVSDKFVAKVRTHVLFSAKLSEKRAVSEIMWKNAVQLNRLQMTIWRREYASIQKHTHDI